MSEKTPLVDCPLTRVSLEIRRGFIQKVYGILTVQLLITVAIATPLSLMNEFVAQNSWVLIVSVVVSLATLCAMACSGDAARRFF